MVTRFKGVAWKASLGLSFAFVVGSRLLAGEFLQLEPVGCYHSGVKEGGAAEVISYHPASRTVFAVNTNDNEIDIVSIADPVHPQKVRVVPLAEYGHNPTSVSARADIVAASVLSTTGEEPGKVVFMRPDGTVVGAISVGWHPDMVMFTPDGRHLIVANEGEPTPDGKVDGDGSVSVIDVPQDLGPGLAGVKVRDAGFQAWNNEPLPGGARVVNRKIPFSKDVEPEGIAISADSSTAYVSLQESNAIAVVDIATAHVTHLLGLGQKDFSCPGNEIDVMGKGITENIVTCPIRGLYQPDNVGWLTTNGESFLLLANEGDSRGNDVFQEGIPLKEATLDEKHFPERAKWQLPEVFGNVMLSKVGDIDGDGDLDELHTFGARSLSIVTTGGHHVYDSGSGIEKRIAARLLAQRKREPQAEVKYSVKKGPEPEGLAIGKIQGKTFAFLGLERDNGIVAFDVTDPRRARIVDYVNPSEFPGHPADITGDIGPEGLVFIGAETSPNGQPLLAVSNEVSGTITLYGIRIAPAEEPTQVTRR